MKKKIITMLSSILIGTSIFASSANAYQWHEYKDYYGNTIDWFLTDDMGFDVEGWYFDGSNWYYLGGQGIAYKGEQEIDGKWYFFDYETCAMKHDELVKVGSGRYGVSYWANSDGSLDIDNPVFPQAMYDIN